jgi:hypothetical protein
MIETNVLVNATSVKPGEADSSIVTVLIATRVFIGWFVQDWYKRRKKRENLTCALLTEVKAIDHVIDQHLNKWWLTKIISAQKAANYAHPLPPLVPFSIDVYDQLADKIGLLDRELEAVIIDYYRMLHFINKFQASADLHQSGLKIEFCDTYTKLLEKQLEKVRDENTEKAKVFKRFFEKYDIKN